MTDSSLPLIVEPAELAPMLPNDKLLLVAVVAGQVYQTRHIPGSVLIEPAELMSGLKPAVGKIPSEERLSALFSRIGLSEDTHVVAYDDEGGGWAGRLIWTLDVLGHGRSSYLNGGLHAWLAAGLPLTGGNETRISTDFQATVSPELIASKEQVLAQLEDDSSVVWDARAPEEYTGRKVTALRNGHIPGARNLDWLELMDRDNDLRLKPLPEIEARLEELGITPDKSIITHCQTHHRSGLTYLVGKALGRSIRAYDGSWSEWGNSDDTPVDTGEA